MMGACRWEASKNVYHEKVSELVPWKRMLRLLRTQCGGPKQRGWPQAQGREAEPSGAEGHLSTG